MISDVTTEPTLASLFLDCCSSFLLHAKWRVLLSYILFALRNLKDLKSQVLFLKGETGTLEGRLPILWGKRGEKENYYLMVTDFLFWARKCFGNSGDDFLTW